MKYCRSCKIFYSDDAAACPKCGVDAMKAEASEVSSEKADRNRVLKDWLWIIIGVPAFIGLIYLLVLILRSIN